MSTIDQIVKVEAEATALLATAQKEAEVVRQEGLAAAAAIRAEAAAKKAAAEAALRAEADKRIQAADDQARRELQGRLDARQQQFDKRAPAVITTVVNALLDRGF